MKRDNHFTPIPIDYLGPLIMLLFSVSFLAFCYMCLKICNYYIKQSEENWAKQRTFSYGEVDHRRFQFCPSVFGCCQGGEESGSLLSQQQRFYASTVSLGRSASPESQESQLTFVARTRDRIRFLSFSEESRRGSGRKTRLASLPVISLPQQRPSRSASQPPEVIEELEE
ncbi:uncharacterized protein LOC100177255 [Ciona intestinalis]